MINNSRLMVKKPAIRKLFAILLIALLAAPVVAQEFTDNEIRQLLIQQSIAAYSGNCPCPYNVMRDGRRCGGNSAYSKPGGADPLCYESDVSDAMIERYRNAHQ